MVFYSKLFTCPFHSLHFSFGFQRLPSRHSCPIDSLGPSFHSLPSYDLLRSCALPSVFRCFEITSHFMVFYSKLFTCPFHSLHFSFGFQRLPSRHSWPIDSLGPFTRYQAMIYYAAVHYPAFLDVLRLPHISWYFTASFSPAPSIAYIFHVGFNVYLPGILALLIRLVLAFTRYQAMIYYAAVHYPAFLDVLRLPHISWYFTASFSPAPSIACIFHLGFNVYLPGILALLIRLVLAFTRYQAMIYYAAVHYPAFLDVLRLPHISWYFTASFSPAPSIAYIFHLGFNVYLPGILGILICLVLAFTRYQAMIYYAAVHCPAFLDVLRLPHISWYFTASFSPAPSIAYIFHLGFNVYLPGILGLLICLVLAFTRYQATIYYAALPSDLRFFPLPYISWNFTASFSPAPSIAYIFHLGFNVCLPGILGLLIRLVLAFTRYQAMIYYAAVHYPAFLDVLRLPHISWYFTASFSPAPSIAYIFHLGFNVYLPGILGLLIRLVLAFTRYQATIYYAAVHYPAFLDVLRLPHISWYFTASFSPAPSIAYIFHLGFNVYLPGILGLLIRLVLAFTRYQAMIYYAAVHYPAFLDVLRLPHISWYFTASFSPAPSIAYIFHLGFNVYLPGILGLLICLVLAFTRYQAMIYYAAVHYPAFLDVLRLPHISWYFTASFSPAPSIAYMFHLGFNVYLPGILGLLIRLVLAFTRYQAMIYYAAVHYPAFFRCFEITSHFMVFYSKLFTCPFHSLHFSFGFQRLPSRHSWHIDLLGPSFHSLPSYDLLRSCALPSVFRCFEITSHFMVFNSKLFTCPFHSLHFSFGFQRLPSRHSWPIDLLGPSFHSLPSYDLLRSSTQRS